MAYYGEIKPGDLLGGRYRVERELGRGNFGVVFRAMHEVFGRRDRPGFEFRRVAVKLFVDTYVTADNVHEVFREATALEALAAEARGRGERPHVAEVFDLGVFEDRLHQPYVVMEFVEGGSLESRIRLGVPARRAVELLRQVCAGVKLAHAQGLYHRDLKPANVLFTGSEFLKVSDFGVAIRRVDALLNGGQAGTISYTPPETGADVVTGAYDVYSLGVMLLEFLLKRNPLEALASRVHDAPGGGERLLEAQRLVADLRDPETRAPIADSLTELRGDAGLQEILRCCLAVDASARYRDAAGLDDALARWQAGRPVPPPSGPAAIDPRDEAAAAVAVADWPRAEAALLVAKRSAPGHADLSFRLAEVYAAMGRWKDAVLQQEEGMRRTSRSPGALQRLADFYEAAGQRRAAAAARDEALRGGRGDRPR